ncbi:hypothetical protein NE237_004515 [Protea cynaroides]|uniref:Uncharacterized protein n=1 Tax=Protea cynaroides TaxID=273540 RepID=A0A9Q0KJK6_9MAGN|nr:hypothetical protein NE237_004515 [Protea cynaroides]
MCFVATVYPFGSHILLLAFHALTEVTFMYSYWLLKKGNFALSLPSRDKDSRFGDAAGSLGSGTTVAMDVSSVVTKAVADAIASLIPCIIYDTMKNSGYDMVSEVVSTVICDASNAVTGGASDTRVLVEFPKANKHISGGDPGARELKTLDGNPIAMGIWESDCLIASDSARRNDNQLLAERSTLARVSNLQRPSDSVEPSSVVNQAGSRSLLRHRRLVWWPVQRQRRISRQEKGKGILRGSSSTADQQDRDNDDGVRAVDYGSVTGLADNDIPQSNVEIAVPMQTFVLPMVSPTDIADKEADHNDDSSNVDESDHSQKEDVHNNGDVDPNETSTINGSSRGKVASAMPGTIVVSYNEVEKVDNVFLGQLDSFDVVRPTRGRLKKMATKGGKETPAVSK